MSDIQLNNLNNDIDLSSDSLRIVSGCKAIRQNIMIRLKFFLGEGVLDTRIGIPYFESILGKQENTSVISTMLKDAILTTAGVESILSFDLVVNRKTRISEVSFEASVSDGDIITVDRSEFIL